jgi:outer membrane protein assembly factor BamB
LLWRRYVGYGTSAPAILVGQDVLVIDSAHNDLLRLDATTGRLIWRQTLDAPIGEMLVSGDRALVPTKSGRLYTIDVKSGDRTGYVQFAQSLPVAPAADRLNSRAYLPGERGTVYSISLADMKAVGVQYLGHAPGSIRVPFTTVMDKVAVIENDGVETARLRLLALDNKGAISKQVADRRLNGLATGPPLATGRGMIVVTDRGQVEAYDVGTGNNPNALTLVAARDATGSQPLHRYVAVTGRNVWTADTQLTKFSVVPTGNRFPVEEIENNFAGSTFDHPLLVFGDALVHVRRPKNRSGYVVTASDTKQGHPIWETDVAIPPAGAPVVDESTKSLAVASAEGYVFRFDEAAIRSRVQDQPVTSEPMPAEMPPLTETVALGQGRAAICAPGANRLLLYTPAAGAKWVQLESPLACSVSPLGTGFIAPLKIGQVFYLSSTDGTRLATPFQPRLDPQSTLDFKPAAPTGNDNRQFVITDGKQKLYLVGLADKPQPHLEAIKEADTGAQPIGSPLVVLGDTALGVAGGTRMLRFRLPGLESAGETNLPAPVEWGPYRLGDLALTATADGKLLAISRAGQIKWQSAVGHGALAGPPLAVPDGVLLAYRKGVLERRSLSDGKSLAAVDIGQPIATGPVEFLQRFMLTSNDGTLLVVDKP